jgi:hypothetical protein
MKQKMTADRTETADFPIADPLLLRKHQILFGDADCVKKNQKTPQVCGTKLWIAELGLAAAAAENIAFTLCG